MCCGPSQALADVGLRGIDANARLQSSSVSERGGWPHQQQQRLLAAKLTALACELACSPRVLLVDGADVGLSPAACQQLLTALSRAAAATHGACAAAAAIRSVWCVPARFWQHTDAGAAPRLLCLAGGVQVFHGRACELEAAFLGAGLPRPQEQNAAQHLQWCLMDGVDGSSSGGSVAAGEQQAPGAGVTQAGAAPAQVRVVVHGADAAPHTSGSLHIESAAADEATGGHALIVALNGAAAKGSALSTLAPGTGASEAELAAAHAAVACMLTASSGTGAGSDAPATGEAQEAHCEGRGALGRLAAFCKAQQLPAVHLAVQQRLGAIQPMGPRGPGHSVLALAAPLLVLPALVRRCGLQQWRSGLAPWLRVVLLGLHSIVLGTIFYGRCVMLGMPPERSELCAAPACRLLPRPALHWTSARARPATPHVPLSSVCSGNLGCIKQPSHQYLPCPPWHARCVAPDARSYREGAIAAAAAAQQAYAFLLVSSSLLAVATTGPSTRRELLVSRVREHVAKLASCLHQALSMSATAVWLHPPPVMLLVNCSSRCQPHHSTDACVTHSPARTVRPYQWQCMRRERQSGRVGQWELTWASSLAALPHSAAAALTAGLPVSLMALYGSSSGGRFAYPACGMGHHAVTAECNGQSLIVLGSLVLDFTSACAR